MPLGSRGVDAEGVRMAKGATLETANREDAFCANLATYPLNWILRNWFESASTVVLLSDPENFLHHHQM